MLIDRYPPEGVFARVPELADQTDPVLVQLDRLLEDDQLYQQVRADLVRRYRLTAVPGRHSTPAEALLRLLVVKHLYAWSDEATDEAPVVQASGEAGAEGETVVEAAEVTEEAPVAEEAEEALGGNLSTTAPLRPLGSGKSKRRYMRGTLREQNLEDALPQPSFAPAAVMVHDGLPWSEDFGQLPPGRSRPGHGDARPPRVCATALFGDLAWAARARTAGGVVRRRASVSGGSPGNGRGSSSV